MVTERMATSYILLSLGSRILRSASPKKFAAKTAILIPRPGKIQGQGSNSNRVRLSDKSLPQEGVGGGTPIPKKLRDASAKKAVPKSAEQ